MQSRAASRWLVGLSFCESFCFPFPVDPLRVLFCIHDRQRTLWHALRVTVASVLGGLAGYALGALLWQQMGNSLVALVLTQATFEKAQIFFVNHERFAVLLGAFTPLPYKAITLTAGFCQLPVLPFLVYSIVGRGARFFLVATLAGRFGKQIHTVIDQVQIHLLLLILAISGLCWWLLF